MIGILDNCELKSISGKCYDDAYLPIYDELSKIKNIGELNDFIEDFDSVLGPRLYIADGFLGYEIFENSFLKVKVIYEIEGFCGFSEKNINLKFWH